MDAKYRMAMSTPSRIHNNRDGSILYHDDDLALYDMIRSDEFKTLKAKQDFIECLFVSHFTIQFGSSEQSTIRTLNNFFILLQVPFADP